MNISSVALADNLAAPDNFVVHLEQLARQRPAHTALIVVQAQDGQDVERAFSYHAFAQRVRALAAVLQRHFSSGERVLILLDNDEHYAISMFACFYAGVIAVPVFPPESASAQHLARLDNIAADAQARGILIAGATRSLVSAAAGLGQMQRIVVDEIELAEAQHWRERAPASTEVAFLQYTSGSTSAPKGVMVTHGCLMANERAIREGLSVGPDDKFGVWSPLFHDMGLIGGLLQPFFSAIPCVLCSPRYFLERPVRWLQMIARHRVSISGGPDFAYRLCLDRIKDSQLERLDLSSWRVAYTGAEPVRHQTMEAFVERFSSIGFSAGAVYACYGLAEATLFVTGGQRGSGMTVQRCEEQALSRRLVVPAAPASGAGAEPKTVALVGCGSVPSGHHVRIVEAASGALAATGAIGEIWAAGPSIAAGYWNKPDQTAQTFVEADGMVWLRTGDLGFWHQGELFVAGRLKDMIIVRGHNIYPQDIEQALEAQVEAVRKGRVAAFAVNLDGTEGIGVAAEVSRGLQKLVPPQALSEAIATVVSEQCGEAPAVVVLLNPGALPKTSSGKLQRGACRTGWAERTLDAYATFEHGRLLGAGVAAAADTLADDAILQMLASLWSEVLENGKNGKEPQPARYAADTHFLAHGGNSLAAVQLAARIEQQWQIAFPARLVFEQPRLQQQAALIRSALQAPVLPDRIPRLADQQRRQALPLSQAQQRQWFLWQLAPQSTAYHVQGALRLTGKIDASAMRLAFADLMLRHESMCTVFQLRADGVVEQRLQPELAAGLEYIEVAGTGASTEDAMAQATDILRARHAQVFDLTRGPLVRASLLRINDQLHLLALAMHHIISDGTSMQILIDELSVLYAARIAAQPASLPPLAVQYPDYAVWQHSRAHDSTHAAALAYWMRQLETPGGREQPVLTLPTDHPRQVVARYRARQHRFTLPEELVAALRQQAQQSGTTLFTLLLTGFQAMLYRYTGQQDIRIGVPAANRNRAELLNVVGFFVNTLVLRSQLNGRTSFTQLLEQARVATLEAQIHQALPFEQLVDALQPERSLTHSALFQVMFNHLQEDYGSSARRFGSQIEECFLPDLEAQFELTLDTREHADGRVTAMLTYARELFEPQRIEHMAGHYLAGLHALSSQPQQAIGDFDMLSPEQRQQLQAWGVNPQRYPDHEPIHRMIQRQAQLRPQATALVLGERQLSYAQLEACANRLAHRLVKLGVQPEQRVGLAMDRSLDMVVALLAILKAGGTFVPLDPHYPKERLAAMVEDSRITLALTQAHVRGQLPTGQKLVLLEADQPDNSGAPTAVQEEAPAIRVHPQQLAYVIYTSGSTGRPKGVAVAHHALVEHAQLSAAFSSLSVEDRMLQFATLNFDGFIEQLFPPLLVGATVVLRGPALWTPDDFLQALRQQRISIADLPTAYWFALIQSFARHGHSDYGSLRELHIGGEAMAAESIAVWNQAGLQDVKLLNTYGPTEAVVVASLLDCTPYVRGERGQPLHMPIGRPLAGRCLHVLDGDLQAVPAGVSGELYIGGTLLARGYLERPALTAERFVADPADPHGGRLYRTGDRVRWNAGGELEYLGRIDHQVKIRGFRVEPGEIEAQLLAQPEVREAIVVVHDARLTAYVCVHAAQPASAAQLRERLLRTLPDYMVPAAVVVLEAMPLNPNGKIDRHALPLPGDVSRSQFEVPVGAMEARLAAIWSDLLGIERVGRSDNFFELGGHSLLLLLAHERIKALPLEAVPTVVDLLRYPTIASLSAFLTTAPAPATDHQPALSERAARQRQGFLPRKKQAAGADS